MYFHVEIRTSRHIHAKSRVIRDNGDGEKTGKSCAGTREMKMDSMSSVDFTEPTPNSKLVMFHLGFKLAAILEYLFASAFSDNFVVVFVTCIILLAFDFWTVKNVSGRLLVGLRWWNDIKE
eukprot:g8441.t1